MICAAITNVHLSEECLTIGYTPCIRCIRVASCYTCHVHVHWNAQHMFVNQAHVYLMACICTVHVDHEHILYLILYTLLVHITCTSLVALVCTHSLECTYF